MRSARYATDTSGPDRGINEKYRQIPQLYCTNIGNPQPATRAKSQILHPRGHHRLSRPQAYYWREGGLPLSGHTRLILSREHPERGYW